MMKQKYLLIAVLALLSFYSFGSSQSSESIGVIGTAVNGIPADYQNDLWLNTNYREMEVGETYNIVSRRVPEVIDDAISNNVALPPFNYEVVAGSSISVDEDGVVTALSLGTSVIMVTYEEFEAYGSVHGAVSDVNKAYMVVDVIDNTSTDIEFTSGMSIRSYDTYYFTEGSSTSYTFSLTATNADEIQMFCNGVEATNSGDNYTVEFENRANIIEVIATNSTGTRRLYYVVDAREIEINIENLSNPGEEVVPGNEVSVSFYGIVIPVYKLATIYNPCFDGWGGELTKVRFDNETFGTLETNDSGIGQYSIADNNSITFTIENSGTYNFTNGRIFEMWWGSELGADKDLSGPGEPDLDAPTNESDFSIFPDFQIVVAGPYHFADFEDITLESESVLVANASSAEQYETVTETYNSWNYSFNSSSTNWGSMTSWFGFSISNQTDNTTAGGVENQFNSAATGDIENSGNYAVIFDANSGGMNMGPEYDVKINITDQPNGVTVSGCYLNNNTYGTTSMLNGDGFAKQFGGESGDDPDWFKVSAEGFDSEGVSTGTTDFYLSDFRNENNDFDYILEDWMWFDLSSLGQVSTIKFSMNSSDVGDYGMNTPAYFCIDNIDKQRLILNSPIDDITANVIDENLVIDLSEIFSDVDNADAIIEKSVLVNSDNSIASAEINGNSLSIDFLNSGNTTLVIKAKSMGMMTTDTIEISVLPATNSFVASQSNVSIYPNPCKDYVIIDSDNIVESIEIISLSGAVVATYNNTNKIDLSNLESGIYFVRTRVDGNFVSTKLIKE